MVIRVNMDVTILCKRKYKDWRQGVLIHWKLSNQHLYSIIEGYEIGKHSVAQHLQIKKPGDYFSQQERLSSHAELEVGVGEEVAEDDHTGQPEDLGS